MKRYLLLTPLIPLALAACGRNTAQVPPAPNPPPNKIDLSRQITARGTEPFWALTIDGKTLKLTRPDKPPMVATAARPTVEPGQVRWDATGDAGRGFKVTLYSSFCSDGMSDIRYPLTAEVDIVSTVLHGCAAKTADLPNAPKKDPASSPA